VLSGPLVEPEPNAARQKAGALTKVPSVAKHGEPTGPALSGASEAGRVGDRCVRSVKPPIET
jgi:hypothetical protein